MFSRAELVNAIQFVVPSAERIQIYYEDDDGPRARIIVSTDELEPLSEYDMEAVCMTCRDFVPPEVSLEVATVTAPIMLGSRAVALLDEVTSMEGRLLSYDEVQAAVAKVE